MKIINKKISEISPYIKNAKKHDKKQINNVAESIKQYGFVQPVVIDADGIIVIGHCRVLAADRKQTTVLNFDRPTKNKEHPTMKPIALFDYQIKNNTKGGDAVLDLFAGSGTTIMACEQNGRKAFCMEYDPKYVDVIIDRWEKFTGQKAVLVNDNSRS